MQRRLLMALGCAATASCLLSGCSSEEPEVIYSYRCNDGRTVTGDSYKVHAQCGSGGSSQLYPDIIGGSNPQKVEEERKHWGSLR